MDDDACVLIVEGDILVRSALADYLRDCGYRVLEAANGDEAREILIEPAAAVDLMLANVNAPKDSGFLLAVWVRKNCPHVEVELVGSPETATQKAGDICADGPAPATPYDHKFVLDRIRRLMAARERSKDES
ncbi:MAG TPA: response regulator [Methylovirgula sp.]|jgi:CheY-like chemotaxis protein